MVYPFGAAVFILLHFAQAAFPDTGRAEGDGPAWDHEGNDGNLGVDHWGDGYPTCNGQNQSPITFEHGINISSELVKFTLHHYDTPICGMIWKNKGYTVELELPEDMDEEDLPAIEGGHLGGKYYFRQLHFHFGTHDREGSEHEWGNFSSLLEMHLVHTNPAEAKDGRSGIAVLGVPFWKNTRSGSRFECWQRRIWNGDDYDRIFNASSEIKYKDQKTEVEGCITLKHLLPKGFLGLQTYMRYEGSLTTPPCTEGVIWTVFNYPVCVKGREMDLLRDLRRTQEGEEPERNMAPNYRPPQPLNNREIKRRWWLYDCEE